MYANDPVSAAVNDVLKNFVPPLPPSVKQHEAYAHQASPTLDAMIEYIRHWATRSYEGYFEGVALWVLSTIAARRVVLPWQEGVWTNLYIMLVADSTQSAKTKAAAYGLKILQDCRLTFLLAPEEITPQKLLSKMSGVNATVPRNYALMDHVQESNFRRKLAFSGQKGWLYDEFGDMLQEIVKGKGNSGLFYKLLKKLYDNRESFTYDTRSWGEEEIGMPYLSILGTVPPSSLKPIMGADSAMWTDGAIARMAWITAPRGKPQLDSAPDGEAIVPSLVINNLRAWHDRLGEPVCTITEKEDSEDGKKKGAQYDIARSPLSQTPIYWSGSGVREAHQLYYEKLVMLAHDYQLDVRFKSTYGRLPDMALKIAMLLASLENNDHMDMRHWGRGQQITERWRTDFHELVAQLAEGNETKSYGILEEKVIEEMTTKMNPGEKRNSRFISRLGSSLLKKEGSPEVRKVLDELSGAGQIGKFGNGRAAIYWILTDEEKEAMK